MSSEKKQTTMQSDALDLVRLRNNFYRDNYRKVMSSLLVCLLTIALLLGVIFYMITHRPAPRYFAASAAGRIVPLTPLMRPNQNDPTILQWANQAVVTAYSIDFDRYRQQLQYASQYFTRDGWNAFIAALKASNNLEAIKSKKLIMHAVATGAPVVINRGIINDQYSWQIQMQVLVVLVSASRTIQQPLTITMMVSRVSTLDNPKGVEISQFVASPLVGQQGGDA